MPDKSIFIRELLDIPVVQKRIRSKTKIYELIGLGKLVAVKIGSRTKIDAQSLADYLDNLPAASIAPPRRRD